MNVYDGETIRRYELEPFGVISETPFRLGPVNGSSLMSPDGRKYFIMDHDLHNELVVVDTETNERTVLDYNEPIYYIRSAPRQFLGVVFKDKVLVLDTDTFETVFQARTRRIGEHAIAFSHDMRVMAFTDDKRIVVVSMDDFSVTSEIPVSTNRIFFPDDGSVLAYSDSKDEIILVELPYHGTEFIVKSGFNIGNAIGVVFSHDGDYAAVAKTDKSLVVLDHRIGVLQTYFSDSPIRMFVFTEDSNALIVVSDDYVVRVEIAKRTFVHMFGRPVIESEAN
jgi:WD40 repeat protein